MRPAIEVRPAEPADLADMVRLCLAAREESAVGSQVCSPDPVTIGQQLGALAAAPGGTLLLAISEGGVVGMLLGRVLGPSPFSDDVALAVEALYVDPAHRRRGAGHALMVGAADVASAAGATQVYAAPVPGARGMQRFFVRLGFAPAASHRVTTTTALQRRLSPEGAAARRPGPRGLEDLIARRRQSRADAAAAAEVVLDQPARRAGISRHVRRAVQTRRDLGSTTAIS